jgi:hypothetical protein
MERYKLPPNPLFHVYTFKSLFTKALNTLGAEIVGKVKNWMNVKRYVICYVVALATGACFFVAGIDGAIVAVAVPVCSVFTAMTLYWKGKD